MKNDVVMLNEKKYISVQGLKRSFPSPVKNEAPVTVFDDLWFDIAKGEFVCLIGHSGCGKTTLLNILAGLDLATEGVVLVDDKEENKPSLDRAVVFQSHALMPWMTVMQNISFAVKSRHPDWSIEKIKAHAKKYIDLVRLKDADEKKPSQLSGGMKQRVGIARALSVEPKILLLDEPFSALDALTRGSLQEETLNICRETKQTVFMITHDIDEAILLADRVILMTNGPEAKVREIVVNTLPKDRSRDNVHKHPNYYPMRNHLMDFLVTRSTVFKEETSASDYDPKNPPVVAPDETTEDIHVETNKPKSSSEVA